MSIRVTPLASLSAVMLMASACCFPMGGPAVDAPEGAESAAVGEASSDVPEGTANQQGADVASSSANMCPRPVPSVRVEPVKTDDPWLIYGDRVGIVPVSGGLPDALFELEGADYEALVEAPRRGLDSVQAMEAGLETMDGNRMVRLSSVDMTVELTFAGRIAALWPGKGLRTPEGTGIGSTLSELQGAHGGYQLNRVPEPFQCSVAVPGRENVWFLFKDCEAACGGARAVKVGVYGDEDDED